MKVIITQDEILESVQAYITNVLGSNLVVTEISVIAGRDSNGSRIEAELSKAVKPAEVKTFIKNEEQPVEQSCLGTPVEEPKTTKAPEVAAEIKVEEVTDEPVVESEPETASSVEEEVQTVEKTVNVEEAAPEVEPLTPAVKKVPVKSFFTKKS